MRHFNLNLLTALGAPIALVLSFGSPVQASELDSRIESSAKSSYNFKTFLKNDKIKVDSANGVVVLTGTVSEEFHRSLAQDTVSSLPGVKSVDNQLTLVGDQPADASDGWLRMKVKTVLAFHKNVSATATEVNAQSGVITLSGHADSEAQKQLTSEYAKDVEGVTEVRNDLIVSNSAKRTVGVKVDDASITAQVKSSLLFHKSTHAMATKVITKNGAVTLSGEAKNAAEKELVTKLTEDIHGVKLVNNMMTVQKS